MDYITTYGHRESIVDHAFCTLVEAVYIYLPRHTLARAGRSCGFAEQRMSATELHECDVEIFTMLKSIQFSSLK
eukprot:scaffold493088_cov18-Prasinocladus_malaysianus.AAC.1